MPLPSGPPEIIMDEPEYVIHVPATVFPPAKAEDMLPPELMEAIGSCQDEMSRDIFNLLPKTAGGAPGTTAGLTTDRLALPAACPAG